MLQMLFFRAVKAFFPGHLNFWEPFTTFRNTSHDSNSPLMKEKSNKFFIPLEDLKDCASTIRLADGVMIGAGDEIPLRLQKDEDQRQYSVRLKIKDASNKLDEVLAIIREVCEELVGKQENSPAPSSSE